MASIPLFSRNNWADTASYIGGSWAATLPLEHLKDRQVQRVARSNGVEATATRFDVDLGALEPVRVAALVNHNLTQLATWRIRLSSDDPAFAATAWDSGVVDAWPELVPFGALDWGVFNWGQSLPEAEAAVLGGYAVQVLPEPVLCRYARVELFDGTNADGFLQAGRLVLADAFQPALGQRVGWQRRTVDPTRVIETRGGQRWFDRRRKRQRVELEFQALSADERRIVDLFDRIAGIAGDILLVLDPAAADELFRNTVLGTLTELSPTFGAGAGAADHFARRFVLEESI